MLFEAGDLSHRLLVALQDPKGGIDMGLPEVDRAALPAGGEEGERCAPGHTQHGLRLTHELEFLLPMQVTVRVRVRVRVQVRVRIRRFRFAFFAAETSISVTRAAL